MALRDRSLNRGDPSVAIPERPVHTTRTILKLLFGPPHERAFAVRFWDGEVEGSEPGQPPRFTLVLRRPGALRRILLPPSELAIGEAYLRDDVDVEGDLEAAASLVDLLAARLRSPLILTRLVPLLFSLPSEDLPPAETAPSRTAPVRPGWRHSRARDSIAVRFHYNAGNDFYQLWLDRRLVYSCAYFPTGTEDIDAAQTAKLEHICRKLRLKPGERLLDIGCGWGGLIQYAAERYGVQALGITLSEPQARLARERIATAGLADRCRVEVRDYRELPAGASFDKVVSVGMVEHVGRARLATYFDTAFRVLRPGGLFLNHGIVTLIDDSLAARLLWRQGAFIQRYVFPDGELVRAGEVMRWAEQAGFEPRDLENLREHYALTLRQWVRRLESHHEEAAAQVGEPAYRVWRLYMSASAHAFAVGNLGIVQLLLSKPNANGATSLPLTRADLYRPVPEATASGITP